MPLGLSIPGRRYPPAALQTVCSAPDASDTFDGSSNEGECTEEVSDSIFLLAFPTDDQRSAADRDADPCPSIAHTQLMRFMPSVGQLVTVGPVNCPGKTSPGFYTIAADRKGDVYTFPMTWGAPMYLVRAADHTCELLGDAFGGRKYALLYCGLSFVGRPGGESLYVTANGSSLMDAYDDRFGRIDTQRRCLTEIAGLPKMESSLQPPMLAGTPEGSLYGFYPLGTSLLRIDLQRGTTVKVATPGTLAQGASAFAWWKGDFYFFVYHEPYWWPKMVPLAQRNGPAGATHVDAGSRCPGVSVIRYRPKDKSTVPIANFDGVWIRAVSAATCPPR